MPTATAVLWVSAVSYKRDSGQVLRNTPFLREQLSYLFGFEDSVLILWPFPQDYLRHLPMHAQQVEELRLQRLESYGSLSEAVQCYLTFRWHLAVLPKLVPISWMVTDCSKSSGC